MKFTEYRHLINITQPPKSMEFSRAIMWFGSPPQGVVSIGNCNEKIIKVPQYVKFETNERYEERISWVIAIARTAFAGNENVTDIILPPSIGLLAKGAFAGCSNLRNITIPKRIMTIKEGTFAGCTSLENIFYEGTMEEWKKIEIIHDRHEIEFGDLIPGTPVFRVLNEELVNIPGNEAVFGANVHFCCNLEKPDDCLTIKKE